MSRWCMGLPFTETRPVTSAEVDRYTVELKRHQRRIRRQGWLLGLSAAAAALVSLEYVNQERGIPGNDAHSHQGTPPRRQKRFIFPGYALTQAPLTRRRAPTLAVPSGRV